MIDDDFSSTATPKRQRGLSLSSNSPKTTLPTDHLDLVKTPKLLPGNRPPIPRRHTGQNQDVVNTYARIARHRFHVAKRLEVTRQGYTSTRTSRSTTTCLVLMLMLMRLMMMRTMMMRMIVRCPLMKACKMLTRMMVVVVVELVELMFLLGVVVIRLFMILISTKF